VPELPEVETLRRGLERGVRGQQITGILVANPKVLRGQHEAIFEARTVGSTIQRVDRRGKYLLIPLASGRTPPGSPAATPSFFLCIHLKMRGQLLLEEGASAPAAKYHCVSLALSTGDVLRFYDMWTWGEMRALSPEELAGIAGLSAMGREPLEPGWDGTALGAAVAGRAAAIKPALLDQRVVAGVGNIYADESLFRAGIHPERPCRSLTARSWSVWPKRYVACCGKPSRGAGRPPRITWTWRGWRAATPRACMTAAVSPAFRAGPR
jgi:formamidopyrimidine-DNA glycosylase